MERVAIVGSTGSGKSALAEELSTRLKLPVIDLDSLYWQPNWVETPLELFRERVDQATAADRWASAGNYSKVQDLVWSRATTVVWLDYSFAVCGWRLLRRTVRRAVTREELWGTGNRESLRRSFASRDSILWYFATTFRRKRQELDAKRRDCRYAAVEFVRLRSPRHTEQWLSSRAPER